MSMKLAVAAVAALGLAGTAQAAIFLTSAQVKGLQSGTWDTDPASQKWTLFVQQPNPGDYLNPNDEAINAASNLGQNRFYLFGEGWQHGNTFNSSSVYTLTLGFSNGASLTGDYTPSTNSFTGGSTATIDGLRYTLSEFSFTRFLGNPVSEYVATPGGDPNDYAGNFNYTVSSTAVPEPTTWALMLIGFGAIGYSARSSKRHRALQAV